LTYDTNHLFAERTFWRFCPPLTPSGSLPLPFFLLPGVATLTPSGPTIMDFVTCSRNFPPCIFYLDNNFLDFVCHSFPGKKPLPAKMDSPDSAFRDLLKPAHNLLVARLAPTVEKSNGHSEEKYPKAGGDQQHRCRGWPKGAASISPCLHVFLLLRHT